MSTTIEHYNCSLKRTGKEWEEVHKNERHDFTSIFDFAPEAEKKLEQEGVLKSGSDFGSQVSTGVSQAMTGLMGKRYQEMLDTIGAYCYFPLAIAKDSNMAEGTAKVKVKPLSGAIDQAGGLAFAIRDWGNYFVLRVNALEDNFILFEFVNNKRYLRAVVPREDEKKYVNPFMNVPLQSKTEPKLVELGQWYTITAVISGNSIKGYLNDQLLIEYDAGKYLDGRVGLWTKADSVTLFNDLSLERNTRQTI